MLKILFGLLLVINGGLFAFQQGYLDALNPSAHEPSRLMQQLNADKLKLIPLEDAKPIMEPAATREVEKIPVSLNKSVNVQACTEVGNFDAAEARRFETQLATLSLGERLTRRSIQESVRHIVYIPPLAGKEAADRKAGELKQLGIADFFVIQDHSALQWGISLGIFKTEEAARNHLAALNQKGVRSARVGTHGAAATRIAFQLREFDAPTKGSVDKIKEAFPKQEWRDCTSQVVATAG